MGSFVRRVTTGSGATAVQIVHKRGRRVVGIDHIGSAHDEERLALLMQTAAQRPVRASATATPAGHSPGSSSTAHPRHAA
jgi:hypothetical protein